MTGGKGGRGKWPRAHPTPTLPATSLNPRIQTSPFTGTNDCARFDFELLQLSGERYRVLSLIVPSFPLRSALHARSLPLAVRATFCERLQQQQQFCHSQRLAFRYLLR